jgi:4-hydroxybenzoate polyprenyltransferase
MRETIKAYLDLTRAHFAIVWPLLFVSGLVLAFENYGGFSWSLTIRAALIGLFGFTAGMVLNDYIDRERDKRDTEFDKLTRYWRPFGKRPIALGYIPARRALLLFLVLVALTLLLIGTLPFPHSLYVLTIMVYAYSMETFYQLKKRDQCYPVAQLLGRTDFALFPVAGYLCHGSPDTTVLLYFLFFYPFAMAHLGVNDLIDIQNDRARGMKTVTVFYGMRGSVYWVLGFSIVHIIMASLFLTRLGFVALAGFLLGFLVLAGANYLLIRGQSPEAGMKALPMFHGAMFIYIVSIILDFAL